MSSSLAPAEMNFLDYCIEFDEKLKRLRSDSSFRFSNGLRNANCVAKLRLSYMASRITIMNFAVMAS